MDIQLFSERFKELREELGLTQNELLDLFNSKYHYNFGKSSISMYENGKRIPEVSTLNDFANFFEVSLDYLVGNTYERNIEKKSSDINFGKRLRFLLETKNIEGKDFAKALHVQPPTVSNWLNGNRFPKEDMLIKVADFFNVSLDYLLCRTDNPKIIYENNVYNEPTTYQIEFIMNKLKDMGIKILIKNND